MARVIGVGGVFFKTRDPGALSAWYAKHLGLDVESWGGVKFPWRAERDGRSHATVWAPFAADSSHFGPGGSPFMVNLIVDDLDAVLADVRASGCEVDERVEASDFGRFGWFTDPGGHRVELWQPPAAKPGDTAAG